MAAMMISHVSARSSSLEDAAFPFGPVTIAESVISLCCCIDAAGANAKHAAGSAARVSKDRPLMVEYSQYGNTSHGDVRCRPATFLLQ